MSTTAPTSVQAVSAPPRRRHLLTLASGLVILIGALLRLRRYLQDRGLMHDDAQLASNIITKSYWQLLKPLDIGNQAAPVGFLLLQKTSMLLMGRGELAIRFVPFAAAVLALPVIYLLVRSIAGPISALAATGWIALAEPLVRYSAEGKQYSTDVLWTALVLWIACAGEGIANSVLLAVAGSILIWFSHPMLFVVGGIGLTRIVLHLSKRDTHRMGQDLMMGLAWLASFAANYLLISRHYVANEYLRQYWEDMRAFAPFPSSLHALRWYPRTIEELFNFPLGIVPFLHGSGRLMAAASDVILYTAIAVFLSGCAVMARRAKAAIGFLLGTLVLAVAASSIERYPLAERLALFSAPLMILPFAFFMSLGLWEDRSSRVVIAVVAAVLFIYPVYLQAKFLVHPEVLYDAKPVVQYVKANWREGDTLYLHWGTDVLGEYYLQAPPVLNVPPGDLFEGVFEPKIPLREVTYANDLLRIRGRPRVWVVFSMGYETDELLFESILNRRGKLLVHRQFPGGAADLYDLR